MAQIIPFESAALPAAFSGLFQVSDDLSTGVGSGGYPHVSIKGKVFHIVRGDEKTLVTKPEADDEPAASIEVVIVKANSALSKVYYAGGYTEGSDAKPLCYSNDSIKPAADSTEPQASNCATCPHNQWGSRITDNGGQGKACADSRRIAIAQVSQINDPMLLRIPAASLKALAQYNDTLKKRGVPYQVVVTKIGFDYSVAHPALTFKPVGFIDDATAREVAGMVETDVVNNIIGTTNVRGASSPALEQTPVAAAQPAPKPAAPKPAAPKPAAKTTAFASAPVAEPEVLVAEPVEAAQPKKSTVIEVDSMGDIMGELDNLLDD